MSKMKHLLKKLHIGGGLNDHHRFVGATRPVMPAPTPSPSPSPSRSQDSSSSASGLIGTIAAVETAERDPTAVQTVDFDFNLMEEEFQVQLAMAISASDPGSREDPDTAQIDAAKRISLGCSSSVAEADTLVDFLSLRYWGHKVINYNEKVKDGFYDVYGITTNSVGQGKLPLLVDLQTISISENVEYEVILVDRMVDPQLQELEGRAYAASRECPDFGQGLVSSGLIQKIADIVSEKMGGKVKNADEMVRKWTSRSNELRNSLNTVILPLGCLDIGLARHRALLFKVLADRVDLPCMLVKGSYYTGTDDGAVNLIKLENGSEYIIDLMGAPGALIPTEVPSNYLPLSNSDTRGFPDPFVAIPNPCLVLDKDIGASSVLLPSKNFLDTRASMLRKEASVEAHTGTADRGFCERDQTERLEQNSGELIELQCEPGVAKQCLELEPSMATFENQACSRVGMEMENNRFIINEPSEMEQDINKFAEEYPVEMMENDLGSQCESNSPIFGEAAKWEIPWEDLHIGERIGIGSYGEVYHADWNGTEVAVKKFLDQDFSGDALAQFRSEVGIMLRLQHPNVVLFMGAVTRSPNFSILTEFLPRGSLYRLLHRPNYQLDEKRRMRMALDVAKGMNYLHTSHPTIVHRDLKSPNLLVDKNWVVKVCDFGLSRLKHHTFLSSKSTAGTPEWMAPEVLRNEPANEKCDVYSFGVILWELATLRIPWKGLNPMQVVGAVGFQNRRLDIPEYVAPSIAQIIHDCWQREPELRPSFTELMYRLRSLQRLNVDRTDAAMNKSTE